MRNKLILVFWSLLICLSGIGWAEESKVLNGAEFLKLPSPYEPSGQYVHPSIIKFNEPWHGYLYWMAATPYPGGDAKKENPVVLVSQDGRNWELKAIIDETGLTEPYNSDPCLIFEEDHLWIYWRYLGKSPALQRIFRSRSDDGANWGPKESVLEAERESMCSPSIIIEKGNWSLYYSDPDGRIYRRTSPNGLEWGEKVEQRLFLKSDVNFVFTTPKNTHLEVRPYNQGLLMLVMGDAVKHGKNLYLFAGSPNSPEWFGDLEPVIKVNSSYWDGYSIYKASFLPDQVQTKNSSQTKLRIWYSAYRMNPVVFHISYTETLMERWSFTYNLDSSPWRYQERGLVFDGFPSGNGLALMEKSFANSSTKVEAKISNGTANLGLVTRYQNKNNFASFKLERNKAILKVSFNGKQEERVLELNEAIINNKAYNLRLSVNNRVYKGFINEKPVLRLVSGLNLENGLTGLVAAGSYVMFNDFSTR